MRSQPAQRRFLRRGGELLLPVTPRATPVDLALPSLFFWLLNSLLLCAAYWLAVVLLSPELMYEVLALPASDWRIFALALAPFAFCLVLAVRGRVVKRTAAWMALILAAALINAMVFFAVGLLTEEGAVEAPIPSTLV